MKKITSADSESMSEDVAEANVEALRALFPSAFTEGKIDFDVLRQLLGDAVDEKPEKYGLNWHGKRAARQLALTPSIGTLRPNVDASSEWETTQNLMIEGDNLEVLKLLQKSYAGRVKLIYIDPPYNTGGDFVYADDFEDGVGRYLRVTGQVDESGVGASTNSESSGRFHTNWLNMIYPRLMLARNLLMPEGIIFVSIDHGELERLLAVMDEVYGQENFVAIFSWVRTRTPAALSQKTKTVVEYVVAYERSKSPIPLLGVEKPATSSNSLLNQPNAVSTLTFAAGTEAGFGPVSLAAGEYGSDKYTVELLDDVEVRDGRFLTDFRVRARFRWSQEYLEKQLGDGVSVRFATERLIPSYSKDSYGREALPNLIDDKVGVGTNENASTELDALFGRRGVFSYPKPVSLLRYLVASRTDDDDIVMDFFAGSATTGHAVMLQNALDGARRRFVLVQLPEPLLPEEVAHKPAIDYCTDHSLEPHLGALARDRLRLAAELIRKETPDLGSRSDIDFGYRVFELDSSNIAAWEPDRDDLDASLLDSLEHIKDGRSEADILFELTVKLGLDLTAPVETREAGGVAVHSVGAGTLIACLAAKVSDDDVESVALGIAEWHRELDPVGETTVVFRDDAFASDVAKTNMTAILEQHGLATVRSL